MLVPLDLPYWEYHLPGRKHTHQSIYTMAYYDPKKTTIAQELREGLRYAAKFIAFIGALVVLVRAWDEWPLLSFGSSITVPGSAYLLAPPFGIGVPQWLRRRHDLLQPLLTSGLRSDCLSALSVAESTPRILDGLWTSQYVARSSDAHALYSVLVHRLAHLLDASFRPPLR